MHDNGDDNQNDNGNIYGNGQGGGDDEHNTIIRKRDSVRAY